jgi:hypothetical protein
LPEVQWIGRLESNINRLAKHKGFNRVCNEALFMGLMVHLSDLLLSGDVIT